MVRSLARPLAQLVASASIGYNSIDYRTVQLGGTVARRNQTTAPYEVLSAVNGADENLFRVMADGSTFIKGALDLDGDLDAQAATFGGGVTVDGGDVNIIAPYRLNIGLYQHLPYTNGHNYLSANSHYFRGPGSNPATWLHIKGSNTTLSTPFLVDGNTTITGDLVVQGNTLQADVQNYIVQDPVMELGGTTTANDGKDRGILLQRGNGSTLDKMFMGWDTSASRFVLLDDVTLNSEVASGTYADLQIDELIANRITKAGSSLAITGNWMPFTDGANYFNGVFHRFRATDNTHWTTISASGVNVAMGGVTAPSEIRSDYQVRAGVSTGLSTILNTNQLAAYNNGANSTLHLNNAGGAVYVGEGNRSRFWTTGGHPIFEMWSDDGQDGMRFHQNDTRFYMAPFVDGVWEWGKEFGFTDGRWHFDDNLYVGGDVLTGGSIIPSNGLYQRITSNHGYIDIGPQNSSWAHIQTDRAKFYFNTHVTIDGTISSYDQDFLIQRAGASRVALHADATYVIDKLFVSPTAGTANARLQLDSSHIKAQSAGAVDGATLYLNNQGWRGPPQYRSIFLRQ